MGEADRALIFDISPAHPPGGSHLHDGELVAEHLSPRRRSHTLCSFTRASPGTSLLRSAYLELNFDRQ
jgi:hypothetical protein